MVSRIGFTESFFVITKEIIGNELEFQASSHMPSFP